jgi:hypothetical protein
MPEEEDDERGRRSWLDIAAIPKEFTTFLFDSSSHPNT